MNFKRTRAFFNKIRGKKTATGLPINSRGRTPNGTAVNGVNKNGRPVTTNNQSKLNTGNYEIGANGKLKPKWSIN
jgi:hypothetical protein